MVRRSVRSHLGRALLVLGAAGCAPALLNGCGDTTGPASTDPDDLRDTRWDLERIETAAGSIEPVRDAPQGAPSLLFTYEPRDDGLLLQADGGCNLGGGHYRAEADGTLELASLAFTAMLCTQSGVMEVEETFLEALAEVSSFRVRSSRLSLDAGEARLIFEAVSASGG